MQVVLLSCACAARLLSPTPGALHVSSSQRSVVMSTGDSEPAKPSTSKGFYAAYDQDELQALWDVHTQFFGAREDDEEEEEVTADSIIGGGLHEAVLRAIAEGEAEADAKRAADTPTEERWNLGGPQ